MITTGCRVNRSRPSGGRGRVQSGKYARTVGEVVDRVEIREDRVGGTAFERKLRRSRLLEGRSPAPSARLRVRVGSLRDRLHVDASDLALCQARYAQARTAREAANIQQGAPSIGAEAAIRTARVRSTGVSQDVLADILSERRAGRRPARSLCGELPVMSTVMVYNLWPLSHTPTNRVQCVPNQSLGSE